MVGSAMALDLATNHQVTVADINTASLEKLKAKSNAINVLTADVRNSAELRCLSHSTWWYVQCRDFSDIKP